jgi:hypothetical protein
MSRWGGGSCGIDTALALKERFGIPSIFVTATLPKRAEVRRAGIGHLSKPYSEEEIVTTIHAVKAMLRGEPSRSLPSRLRLFAWWSAVNLALCLDSSVGF